MEEDTSTLHSLLNVIRTYPQVVRTEHRIAVINFVPKLGLEHKQIKIIIMNLVKIIF